MDGREPRGPIYLLRLLDDFATPSSSEAINSQGGTAGTGCVSRGLGILFFIFLSPQSLLNLAELSVKDSGNLNCVP